MAFSPFISSTMPRSFLPMVMLRPGFNSSRAVSFTWPCPSSTRPCWSSLCRATGPR